MPPLSRKQNLARLESAFRNGSSLERCEALQALAELGSDAAPTVPALVEALGDDNLLLRQGAAGTLVRMGRPAVPRLLKALRKDNLDLRRALIVILGRIGPGAAEALPALEKLHEHEVLGPCALQACADIRRRRGLMRWLGRVKDLAWLDRSAIPIFAAANLLAALLWLRFPSASGIAPSTAFGFAILGAGLGAILGARSRGSEGALCGAKLLASLGGSVGLAVGSLAATVAEPLVQTLGR